MPINNIFSVKQLGRPVQELLDMLPQTEVIALDAVGAVNPKGKYLFTYVPNNSAKNRHQKLPHAKVAKALMNLLRGQLENLHRQVNQ